MGIVNVDRAKELYTDSLIDKYADSSVVDDGYRISSELFGDIEHALNRLEEAREEWIAAEFPAAGELMAEMNLAKAEIVGLCFVLKETAREL